MQKVACIGSREIEEKMRATFSRFGEVIVMRGHQLHSGNALGSDAAFASGGNVLPSQVHLHLPWSGYNVELVKPGNNVYTYYPMAITNLAAAHHKAWDFCTQGTRRLLTRNASIISVADIIVYFLNENKLGGGGTGHGIRIAESLGKRMLQVKADTSFEELYEGFAKLE